MKKKIYLLTLYTLLILHFNSNDCFSQNSVRRGVILQPKSFSCFLDESNINEDEDLIKTKFLSSFLDKNLTIKELLTKVDKKQKIRDISINIKKKNEKHCIVALGLVFDWKNVSAYYLSFCFEDKPIIIPDTIIGDLQSILIRGIINNKSKKERTLFNKLLNYSYQCNNYHFYESILKQ